MSSKEKHSVLLEASGCISRDAMIRYISNTLEEQEKRIIELHLADCLLCSEAADGLEKAMQSGIQIPAVLLTMDQEFHKKGEIKTIKPKPHIAWYISAAATIAVFIASYFIFSISTNKEDIAINPEEKAPAHKSYDKQPDQQPETTKDAVFQEQIIQDITSGEKTITVTKNPGGADDGKNDSEKIIGGLDNTIDYTGSGIVTSPYFSVKDSATISSESEIITDEVLSIVSGKALSEEDMDDMRYKENKSLEKPNKKKEQQKSEAPVATASGNQTSREQSVISYYTTGDYTSCMLLTKALIAENAKNYTAVYYCAMSLYQQEKYDEAIKYFEMLKSKKDNPFYELGLWYKADIYLITNKKQQARITLEEIVNFGGSFKDKAAQKLKDLE